MYGETSFELICQILDKLHPIRGDNRFVDLGSGVGQVVLQVAALTDCECSYGIEKANIPAKYATVINDDMRDMRNTKKMLLRTQNSFTRKKEI